jgi:hypothetical protein
MSFPNPIRVGIAGARFAAAFPFPGIPPQARR